MRWQWRQAGRKEVEGESALPCPSLREGSTDARGFAIPKASGRVQGLRGM
jgi:hypothetical protein